MKSATFYKIKLELVQGDIIKEAYPELNSYLRQQITLDERLPNNGDVEAACVECGENEWVLYSPEMSAVRDGGKPYCECKKCGFVTHL